MPLNEVENVTQLDLSELHNRQLITTRTCKNYAVNVFSFSVWFTFWTLTI